jgi:putative peptidoglycan lipid II flippase
LVSLVNAALLVDLLIRLTGRTVGQATFPRLAAAVAAGAGTRYRRMTTAATVIAAALAVAAAAGLLALGRPAVRLLFEHGTYDAEAGALTARLVAAYAVGLPAYAATEVLTRALVAQHDTRTPFLTNLAQTVTRVVLTWVLLDQLGITAVPICFAVSSGLETAVLALVVWRREAWQWRSD